MDYKNINDYELIYEVRENDEYAYNTLYNKYKTLIAKLAYDYYMKNKNKRAEYDDLLQEGYYALCVAIREYDENSTLFYTYASLCIKREMERYLKGLGRNKNMLLTESISLNIPLDDKEETYLEEIIPSKENVEKNVLSEEIYKKIWAYRHELSDEEGMIFELKANKFSNKEISTLLDIPYKKVDNCLRKIRILLTKYIKSLD